MSKLAVTMLAAGVVAAAAASHAQSAPRPDFLTIKPAEITWKDIPGGQGAQIAELVGSQDKPGFYVVRVRFPPHVMDTPHRHTRDRYVTVLEGTWMIGTGPAFAPTKATAAPAGSVMFHPAEGIHWDGSTGDAPVVVQIVGIGPVSTTAVDPKGPGWVDVRMPAGR